MTDYRGRRDLPRGVRNNNPGNIDRQTDPWQGMADDQSQDKRFIVFVDSSWGIRAAARVIRNYEKRYGLRTPAGIINRWAPPNENPTLVYIAHVADALGCGPDDELNLEDETVMLDLLRAIFKKELGGDYFTDEEILEGIRMP